MYFIYVYVKLPWRTGHKHWFGALETSNWSSVAWRQCCAMLLLGKHAAWTLGATDCLNKHLLMVSLTFVFDCRNMQTATFSTVRNYTTIKRCRKYLIKTSSVNKDYEVSLKCFVGFWKYKERLESSVVRFKPRFTKICQFVQNLLRLTRRLGGRSTLCSLNVDRLWDTSKLLVSVRPVVFFVVEGGLDGQDVRLTIHL